MLNTWQHYMHGLCECLSASERDILKEELMRNVRKAAETSGGFLGMGKTCSQEEQVLARLESSFGIE